jgi:hypothetical protein
MVQPGQRLLRVTGKPLFIITGADPGGASVARPP